jgi:hypothetical protein
LINKFFNKPVQNDVLEDAILEIMQQNTSEQKEIKENKIVQQKGLEQSGCKESFGNISEIPNIQSVSDTDKQK